MFSYQSVNSRFATLIESFLYIYSQKDLRAYPKLRRQMFRVLRNNQGMLFAPLPIPQSVSFPTDNAHFRVIDWLCARGDTSLVKIAISHLKQQGKTLSDLKDPFDNTALTWALISDTPADFIAFLLGHGADPNLPNKAGTLPIHDLVMFSGQSDETIRKLRLIVNACGGKVLLAQNGYGSTPMWRACFRSNPEIVRELCMLAMQHDIPLKDIFSIPNSRGYTPYDVILWRYMTFRVTHKDQGLVNFIRQNGGAIHGELWKSQTPDERIAYDPTERTMFENNPNLNTIYQMMNGQLA